MDRAVERLRVDCHGGEGASERHAQDERGEPDCGVANGVGSGPAEVAFYGLVGGAADREGGGVALQQVPLHAAADGVEVGQRVKVCGGDGAGLEVGGLVRGVGEGVVDGCESIADTLSVPLLL